MSNNILLIGKKTHSWMNWKNTKDPLFLTESNSNPTMHAQWGNRTHPSTSRRTARSFALELDPLRLEDELQWVVLEGCSFLQGERKFLREGEEEEKERISGSGLIESWVLVALQKEMGRRMEHTPISIDACSLPLLRMGGWNASAAAVPMYTASA